MKIKVVCIQTNSNKFPEKNIEMLDKIFKKIKSTKTNLICLPECVAVFSDEKKRINDFLSNWNNKFLDLIKYYSKRKSSYVLIGSIPKKNKNNKLFNRSLIIDPKGELVSSYDKINLFDVFLSKEEKYLESKSFTPGTKIKMFKLPWGKIGLSICYDLRFPNLYRKLSKAGSLFLSVPSAFTETTGKKHWHSLLRARAIENFCYIFAPAQGGTHYNGRKTFGHSLIISPDGEIIKELKKSEGVITANINPKLSKNLRLRIPSLKSD